MTVCSMVFFHICAPGSNDHRDEPAVYTVPKYFLTKVGPAEVVQNVLRSDSLVARLSAAPVVCG